MRKLFAGIITVCLFSLLFVSCADKQTTGSSQIANNESSMISQNETNSFSSLIADSEQTQSKTESDGIKEYKASETAQLGCFHLNMGNCDANGSDWDSREAEFRLICEQKYFNTYMIGAGQYALKEAQIIAENGGSIWFSAGHFNSKTQSLDSMIENFKFYIDYLTAKGYGDLINGFYWDEPLWKGMTNEDFLLQSEALYKNFGLRLFPVFSLGSFSKVEGNELLAEMRPDGPVKIDPECFKYVSDAGFDNYGVDVREGADNGGSKKYSDWQTLLSPEVKDGKSFYIEAKKLLQKSMGHPVNIWYYPCAFTDSVWGGLGGIKTADEDYCIAHLEFMADDILKEEYVGGLIIYTYYTFNNKTNYGFGRRADIKNDDGSYALYPEQEKWPRYSKLLQDTTKRFNSVKVKKVDIGL